MAQYLTIKAAHPDSLLFYRMGDFYELFFEDAEVASRVLNITLTKRGKHGEADIPMCGVPVHAADDYLQRLIASGHRVAVCEQLEDPAEAKKRGHKAVVRRDVVRLVTPGTISEDNLLSADRNNFLCAIHRVRGGDAPVFGIAWTDMSTGHFQVSETDLSGLGTRLSMIDPSEIILAEPVFGDQDVRVALDTVSAAIAPLPGAMFDGASAADRLTTYYGVATLSGFGTFSRAEMGAAAAVAGYLERTQLGQHAPLDRPRRETEASILAIDPATRANLEITRTLSGERSGSLNHTIDRTVTGPGARALADRLSRPLADPEAIERRLEAVAHFVADPILLERMRADLRAGPDMLRAYSRLALDRGGPRDMVTIRIGIECATGLHALFADGPNLPRELVAIRNALSAAPGALAGQIGGALVDEPPLMKRDGGFVRPGYAPDLDEQRSLRDESRKVIAGLQADYAARAEIRALKVKHNNVLGYFVEVPAAHGDRMMAAPLNETFIHRQTLANAVRFSTTDLSALEAKIARAGEHALALELDCFDTLIQAISAEEDRIRRAAAALAELDVALGLATLALERDYCRPKVDDSVEFAIEDGRHPVVEQALGRTGGTFVANSCDLGGDPSGGRIWLVTGPNMAGKSTFLRQNALIVIMAQIGSFVPAKSAHIGVVDKLFSRVGAADDLARGRSTFMVEMVETAAILNQAGERALVILDEIGRGTATFDGLSIAWAAVEHLHEANRSRALFATHYHELTSLAERLPRLHNATVKVREWKGDLVFLHEIAAGAADRSYGIQVAKLAGLPSSVIERAEDVLARLEETDRTAPAALVDDLPLFSAALARPASTQKADPALEKMREAVAALDPDGLTPREALEEIYRLKRLSQEFLET
ncbi:MAG: DNA mismatch repair protein MutS [Pseudomonadota bacterium]